MGKTKTFFLSYNFVLEPNVFFSKIVELFKEKLRNIVKCVWSSSGGETYVFVVVDRKIKIDGVKSLSMIVDKKRVYPQRFSVKSRLLSIYYIAINGDNFHQFGINVEMFLKKNKYKLNNLKKKLNLTN